jgi:hypothetical protein
MKYRVPTQDLGAMTVAPALTRLSEHLWSERTYYEVTCSERQEFSRF